MDSVDNVDIRPGKKSSGKGKPYKMLKNVFVSGKIYPHIPRIFAQENMWIMWTVIVSKGFPQCLQRLRPP